MYSVNFELSIKRNLEFLIKELLRIFGYYVHSLRAIMYVVEIILTLLLSRIAQNTFIRGLQFKVTA